MINKLLILLCVILAVSLLAIFLFIATILLVPSVEASTNDQPRYRLIQPNAAFIFQDFEELPFQVGSPMCWSDEIGFCDPVLQQTDDWRPIWVVVDFEEDDHGIVYKVGDLCFWWMFQDDWGADGQPHINEHYWVSCPIILFD